MKLTYRYNSILNFIQVSFCFLSFLGLGLGLDVTGAVEFVVVRTTKARECPCDSPPVSVIGLL